MIKFFSTKNLKLISKSCGLLQRVVFSNTVRNCHPELRILARVKRSETRPKEGCVEPTDLPIIQETVSGSQRVKEILNQVQKDENKTITKKDNKNVKNLLPYSLNALLPKKKLAFTLAETLITLGIIGIVAAMTIPNLITTHQKKVTVTRLQKSISVLNQAYKLSVAEQGQPELDDILNMDIEDYFDKYWAPYLKQATYCYSYATCGYKRAKFTGLNGVISSYTMTNAANFTFQTSDGMIYSIQIRGYWDGYPYFNGTIGTNGSLEIIVDINGSKGPNVFGKDVFYLIGSNFEDIGIKPYGYEKTNEEINEECSKNGTGSYCAEKIKRAGWQIDKSYPW